MKLRSSTERRHKRGHGEQPRDSQTAFAAGPSLPKRARPAGSARLFELAPPQQMFGTRHSGLHGETSKTNHLEKKTAKLFASYFPPLPCPPGVRVTGKDLGGRSEERKERVREEMFPASLQLLVCNMTKQHLSSAWLSWAQLGQVQLASGHPQLLGHPQG